MSGARTIYVKFNPARREEYQLVTTIERDGGRLYSFKKKGPPASVPFLESLERKYRLLADAGLPFTVAEPEVTKEGVRFDYLEAYSLDSRVARALAANDGDAVRQVFIDYRELIERIPSAPAAIDSAGFESFFGRQEEGARARCLSAGCLDLILENIYLVDGGYHLIDYEWTFEFPLPVELVLFRTVMNTYTRYHAYNINQLVPAEKLLAEFGIADEDTARLMRMEWSFQNAVNVAVTGYDEFLAFYDDVLYEEFRVAEPVSDLREMLRERSHRLELVEEELRHTSRMLRDREDEIASMKASKFWRAREAWEKARGLTRRRRR